MIIVHVHFTSSGWQEKRDGRIKQRGTCWPDSDALLQAGSTQAVRNTLKLQNGFYALVWKDSDTLYAAVDHIRSIPLFYALKGSDFYLSDDADWVREQAGNTVMDEVAKEEFQLTGYVTGQDTLYRDVKQLQAGEFLCINTASELPKVETERYYRFLHTEPETFNEQELLQQLDEAALAAIDNLIRYANGRQIVIPLSGGYDSRLIATLLKRRGYENILCFTYGVPGNKESAYSKMVADALGLKWHFVEYSNELWREAWQTEERWQYQKWGSGWSSIAHVQDWLAVRMLKHDGVVEDNCVFAPGHCCVTAMLPDEVFIEASFTKRMLQDKLLIAHFSLAPLERLKVLDAGSIYRHLLKFSPRSEEFDSNEYAKYFMQFGWQERQAKFICNSVRVYEFFEYDWWLPLWDMEFINFWEGVPLELRKGRSWYVDYVTEKYEQYSESSVESVLDNASDDTGLKAILKSSIFFKNEWLYLLVRQFLRVIRRVKPVTSPLAYESWFDQGFYERHKEAGYSINGIVAKQFLLNAEGR